jgi:hypothetical protein
VNTEINSAPRDHRHDGSHQNRCLEWLHNFGANVPLSDGQEPPLAFEFPYDKSGSCTFAGAVCWLRAHRPLSSVHVGVSCSLASWLVRVPSSDSAYPRTGYYPDMPRTPTERCERNEIPASAQAGG